MCKKRHHACAAARCWSWQQFIDYLFFCLHDVFDAGFPCMLLPMFKTGRDPRQKLNQRLGTELPNYQNGFEMRAQALPQLRGRAVLVSYKVLCDSVPCDNGGKIVPCPSKEPINLRTPTLGRVTV